VNRRMILEKEFGSGVSRAYSSWTEMRRRVREPNRRHNGKGYIGKSISPSWDSFDNFLADMGERSEGTTLDRIDNSKGYSLENCRWADATTQSRNRTYCKLNVEKLVEVKKLYAEGVSQQKIATIMECSQRAISKALLGQTWRTF